MGPPATAAYSATLPMSPGPIHAPSAASSFTSPPPSALSANNGKKIARPKAQPAVAAPTAPHPPDTNAHTRAVPADTNVSAFGIRRVVISVVQAIAAVAMAANDAMVMKSLRRRRPLAVGEAVQVDLPREIGHPQG